ncbi:MAG: hypothetical protein E7479_00540 [Ruminococcaceae bacterium]|nr:hypothetical protein [Oscillospiraceae bacterium]
MKFNWNPEKIPKILKLNNNSAGSSVSPELLKAQKNILMKAALAFFTIVLTIVILFAMTSAWYTNIVHTSGLVFEVESWGFSGEITVDDRPIQAGPGDSGIVGLSMDGAAGEILDVSVGVSKEAMINSVGTNEASVDTDAMQKRFFFYVDKSGTKNGEQVDRFYINNEETYTYTVFSEGSIRISEDFSNVPELKWQWVYDVLGYYVKGTVIETEGGTVMNITEYLRPIEYDFDKATFEPLAVEVFAEDSEDIVINTKRIATVDGEKTPEQFLAAFSENDGYEGTISTENAVSVGGKTYYYVAEGIYAYLCDYQEIEAATEFDTELGRRAAGKESFSAEELKALQFPATVNVSVQNRKEQETVEAGSADDLREKIDANDGKVIKLTSDIALTGSLEIPENADVEIDLNGKSISFPGIEAKGNAIEVPEGSSLLMLNGKVENESSEKTGRGIIASGAEVTLSGVEINGFDYGLRVTDNAAGNKTDSVIRLYNCKTDAGTCGIYILGNGEASEQKTQLIIEKSELVAEGYVICGGGNPDSRGTDIRIIDSTLEATGMSGWSVGIYQPQKDGNTVIYNSTIEAYMGIALKAGFVEIIDSQIYGNGPYGEPGYAVSGSKDTGDAVYIEANYGHPIGLIIRETGAVDENGNLIRTVLDSKNGKALQVYEPDATNVTVEIISGTFSHPVEQEWIAEGSSPNNDMTVVTVSAPEQEETE